MSGTGRVSTPSVRRRADRALSQARDGFHTTTSQVKTAGFTGECVSLQKFSLARFRTCEPGTSGTASVFTSSVRRLNIHTNEGLGHCGLDLVLVFVGLRHGGRNSGLCRNSSGWLCRSMLRGTSLARTRVNLKNSITKSW